MAYYGDDRYEDDVSDKYGQLKGRSSSSGHYSGGSNGGGDGCFIATAAYGTPFAYEINILRYWRDNELMQSEIGKNFVTLYYKISPSIAVIISKSGILRKLTRMTLSPIVKYFKMRYNM